MEDKKLPDVGSVCNVYRAGTSDEKHNMTVMMIEYAQQHGLIGNFDEACIPDITKMLEISYSNLPTLERDVTIYNLLNNEHDNNDTVAYYTMLQHMLIDMVRDMNNYTSMAMLGAKIQEVENTPRVQINNNTNSTITVEINDASQ